jgi:hypothetical protein
MQPRSVSVVALGRAIWRPLVERERKVAPMARYFFHVVNGHMLVDRVGVDCATLREVRAEAIRAAGEMLSELGAGNGQVSQWHMFVTDAQNRTCLRLVFHVDDLSDEHEAEVG